MDGGPEFNFWRENIHSKTKNRLRRDCECRDDDDGDDVLIGY